MDKLLEQNKYEKAWDHDDYRKYAPGEIIAKHYVRECHPKMGKLIDFGAGTGRGALVLSRMGFDVTMIDIAENCLDDEVREEIGHRLKLACLWEKMDLPRAEEGYCTDVMEHIPPEHVEAVIENTLSLCNRVFFHICLRHDHFGKVLDEHLHLTVKPFTWWRDLVSKYGTILDGRDLIENAWLYVEAK